MSCHICADVAELVREAVGGAEAALVTEESLDNDDVGVLLRWLGTQPPWANFPFVVLATPRGDLAQGSRVPEWSDTINAVLLERPLGAAALGSAVQAALRDRQRQYLVRDYLLEREQAAAHLAAVNASLETRIADRTEALRAAYVRLAEEVREREKTQALLIQAQKVEALGKLAGGIAHDFNNILQAVGGALSIIDRRADDAVSARRLAGLALKAVERGAAITGRLLAFGRRSDLRTETLDVASLFTGLREILTPTLGANIEVNLSSEPNLLFRADKAQLETVLVNLAANARDAMTDGGQLLFSAGSEVVSSEGLEHAHGVAPGRYVRLTVADNGTGMDGATLARACDPFFTTKPQGAGTGLGLAMAVGFASQSGGTLAVDSTPGKGTTVTLWLPAADFHGATDAAPSQNAEDAASIPRPTAKSARVLVVDDEDLVRETLAENLESEGIGVVTAANATDALSLLAAGEEVDAIVTDLSMPGMDGIALIRAAQERRPGLPAVLLTGFAKDDTAIAVSGAISGAFSLLRKPASFHDVLDTVQSLLGAKK
ncbi:MAG: periplasmic sensor hybrid histidine kinase [Methylocystaceae bacterium]|nr:MAG: periplasmic sensor hybrid histidine [Methylocystaceae bacterium]TXT42942.1 MAG: periplasmic sensor hybrid histidine kinase [Methylocystaceae bacterium]